MSSLEKAMLDPSSVYKKPKDVLEDKNLTKIQKVEILRRWEYDALEMQVAEEENMQGENGSIIDQILAALHELDADDESKHGAPTKQGGV